MNIRQIINEEVNAVLQEQEGREVIGALEQIAQGAPGVLPDLEKFVNSNITKFLQKQLASASQIKEISNDDLEQKIAGGIESGIGAASGVAKGVAKGVGKGVGKAAGIPAAKLVGHIGSYLPFGEKLGILIAASQDKSVDTGVRNAIYFALGNLLAGSMGLDLPDLGHLLQQIPEIAWEQLPFTDDDQNWDWGIVNSVDDMALLAWAYRKMKESGVDPRDQLKRFAEFIGRTELIPKEPAGAPVGGAPEARKDMSLDAKIARANAAAAQSAQYREKGRREGMRLKKSEIYNIIREEVEVMLTNEEAEEIFDLDMSALLDEMMGEAESDIEELEEKEDKWIQGADLKKGRCTPMGTPECPEGSPQYNLAKRFKSGDIHKANLKKGKNPHGPG